MKKKEFLKAVDTLKLYRRAELIDEMGHELISANIGTLPVFMLDDL